MISSIFCQLVRILETKSLDEKQTTLKGMIDTNRSIMRSPVYKERSMYQEDICIRELFGIESNNTNIPDGLVFYIIYKGKPMTVFKHEPIKNKFRYSLEYDRMISCISKSILIEMAMFYDDVVHDITNDIKITDQTVYLDFYYERILETTRKDFFRMIEMIKLDNNIFGFISNNTKLKYQIHIESNYITHIDVTIGDKTITNLHPFELYTIEKIKGLIV